MQELLDLIYTPRSEWSDEVRKSFNAVIKARYQRVQDVSEKRNEEKRFQLRVNASTQEDSVPYAALIAPGQELSGAYGGMSFVVFPSDEDGQPALVSMVVGTNGLAPDETILGRPGHARKCAAITKWLNSLSGEGFAWAKRDPVRIDLDIPTSIQITCEAWSKSLDRYGKVIYACFAPPAQRSDANDVLTRKALIAFLDLFFQERRIEQKKEAAAETDRIRRDWVAHALPSTSEHDLKDLLATRRFVIIEGPPGTGKTELARRMLRDAYAGNGMEIQFHPGTTYESFIGGLAPKSGGAMGFTFEPMPGHLMEACREARKNPDQRYVLVIDEINRADLAKVLGEAIYLFEPGHTERIVHLHYTFPEIGSAFSLPPNLDVIGTMNSADRSIAILDIAVRRRFAFVPLWPQVDVVREHSGEKLLSAFQLLVNTFLEHAGNDAMSLLPGHAYFLGSDDVAHTKLTTEVSPLLEEYLAQGYVGGFADEVRAYIDLISQR